MRKKQPMRLHAIRGDAEENLWGNVVVQALREAVGEDHDLRALAIRWIERRENRPCGFDWCCQSLGLQVERLRETVKREHDEANRRWGVGGAGRAGKRPRYTAATPPMV